MTRFSGGFLISISLLATDLECLIKNLIFNSLKFKRKAFKQCPPLLAIPMIWNHLVGNRLLGIVKVGDGGGGQFSTIFRKI